MYALNDYHQTPFQNHNLGNLAISFIHKKANEFILCAKIRLKREEYKNYVCLTGAVYFQVSNKVVKVAIN